MFENIADTGDLESNTKANQNTAVAYYIGCSKVQLFSVVPIPVVGSTGIN